MPFDPDAFRAELDRSDLEWSLEQLGTAAGVGVTTLRHWLSGGHKPARTVLDDVVAVLAFERCTGCAGLGYVDPGDPGREALLNRITKRKEPPRSLRPAGTPVKSAGDGWTLDRNELRLTVADSHVRLTPQESRVIGALVDAGGYFITAAQIAAAVGILAGSIRTHLTRLRNKVSAAGADLGAVVEHSLGAGYRARMANRTEEAS